MKEPKVGATIVVTDLPKIPTTFYKVGDTAVLLGESGGPNEMWMADFTGNDEYRGDGQWFIMKSRFDVIEEPVETEEHSS